MLAVSARNVVIVIETILDTDILSEIVKERNSIVLDRAAEYLKQNDSLKFTSVSVGELLFGLYVKDARRQISKAEKFLAAHEELVPLSRDYRLAAEINAALYRAGRPIGDADALIAACALNRDMSLATGNTRHYQFVIDVGFAIRLENWREERHV